MSFFNCVILPADDDCVASANDYIIIIAFVNYFNRNSFISIIWYRKIISTLEDDSLIFEITNTASTLVLSAEMNRISKTKLNKRKFEDKNTQKKPRN